MSLTFTLMDMWLYSVIRGLILSCGPHTLCCAVKSFYVKSTECGSVQMTGMPHTRFPFALSKHSKQCNIKQNTADTWRLYSTCTQTKPSVKDATTLLLLFEAAGGILRSSTNQIRERIQNDMKSCLTGLYLRSCASGTNVIGQMPRTPCPPLSTALHLRRQQRGMEVLLGGTVGGYVGEVCGRRLNEHEHPLHIMTAAHALML